MRGSLREDTYRTASNDLVGAQRPTKEAALKAFLENEEKMTEVKFSSGFRRPTPDPRAFFLHPF